MKLSVLRVLALLFCAATLALGGVAGAQTITTFAGGGTLTGDGVPATDAFLNVPMGIAIDYNGNVYVAEVGSLTVRRIDGTTGIVTTVAGNGQYGDSGDGGPATEAMLMLPQAVAVDAAGNIFIVDTFANRVRRVDVSTGVITTVAGTGAYLFNAYGTNGDQGPAVEAALASPQDVAVDAVGNLYIADTDAFHVRRVDAATGIITTIAGSAGHIGFSGDGGPALDAGFVTIMRVAVGQTGDVYVLDLIGDAEGGGVRVRRIDITTGIITTVAGGGAGDGESGPATDAKLFEYGHGSLALDGAGNLYVAGAFRVWRVDAAGNISRFAGAGDVTSGSGGDGGPATEATIGYASGLALAGNGDVYLGDGYLVRKITAPVVIPPPDVIIDDTTSQSVLDGLVNPPACVVMAGTNLTTLVMPNLMSIGGCLTITGNSQLTDVDLATGGGIGGSVTISDNPSAADVDLATGGGIGGDVTISDNPSAADVDLAAGGGIGGSVTISDNPSAADVDLAAGGGIGGSVTITNNGDATVTIDTPSVGRDLTVSTGSQLDLNLSNTTVDGNVSLSTRGTTTVSGQTGGGTTSVTFVNGSATMNVLLAKDTFATRVPYSIQALGSAGALTGPVVDASSTPVNVTELAAYRFTFGITTLDQDATLTFDISLAALDAAGQTTLLDAVASSTATLAVQGDAPGSVAQVFDVCTAGQPPVADGCVEVVQLDAMGNVILAGDPTVPATIRFVGITGHFSTFAVVLVSPIPDTTPPAISNVPAPIVAEATSTAGAVVSYAQPTALDDRDGLIPVTCAPASGSTFPVGTTTVTCDAVDAAGNASTASFTVTINPFVAPSGADLQVTTTASPEPVTLGSPLTYTVTVSNAGPTAATGAWVTHTSLGIVRFVSATASQGRCIGIVGLALCNLGTLASGATATVTVVVVPRASGSLTGAAFAWSAVTDPNLANNRATVITVVR